MTILQIQYALEVAHCKSISFAAKNLFISQSALSQQLHRLEDELKYPIFIRTTKSIQPTPQGERFIREAEALVSAWDSFQVKVNPTAYPKKYQLRIGLGTNVYSNGLFTDIARFLNDQPHLEVTFITETGRDFISGLISDKLDLAIDRILNVPVDRNNYHICNLIREQQCILMSVDDPRAKAPCITFQDIQDSTMLTGLENSTDDKVLHELCQKYSVNLKRIIRSDSIETIVSLVRDGKGVAIGPHSFANYYHVAAVPLEPYREETLKFICLQRMLRRKEILSLRNFLLSLCKSRGILDKSAENLQYHSSASNILST